MNLLATIKEKFNQKIFDFVVENQSLKSMFHRLENEFIESKNMFGNSGVSILHDIVPSLSLGRQKGHTTFLKTLDENKYILIMPSEAMRWCYSDDMKRKNVFSIKSFDRFLNDFRDRNISELSIVFDSCNYRAVKDVIHKNSKHLSMFKTIVNIAPF